MSVQFKEFKPSESLNQFVELYWQGDFNIQRLNLLSQRVIPNGYVELIIHTSDVHCILYKNTTWSFSPNYTIIGLYTEPYIVQFNSHVKVFGIRFKPEGVYNVFGVPASEFKATYDDMENVLGQEFRDYCHRLRDAKDMHQKIALTEKYLFRNHQRHNIDANYVNRAAEIIRQTNGFIRMEELSDQVFISMRQLERAFKNQIGITPKLYMRLSRLNEVQRQLENNKALDFIQITYDCGYADQAHFIREFKNFTGEIPTIFVKDRQEFIVNAHVAHAIS